jgi:hypothetical protein
MPSSSCSSDEDDDPLFGEDGAWDDAGRDASSESESSSSGCEEEPEPAQRHQATSSAAVVGPAAPRSPPSRSPVLQRRVAAARRRGSGDDGGSGGSGDDDDGGGGDGGGGGNGVGSGRSSGGRGVRRILRAEGERSDSVALADPTGRLNIAEIRPVAKEALLCEELVDALCTAVPPVIEARRLVAPLDGAILRNVLSKQECASLIASTDGMGYSFWDPSEKRRDFRSADTVEVHSKALAQAVWRRILPHIAALQTVVVDEAQARWEREIDGDWTAYGVNHELLFGRYRAGGHFSPHTDGNTVVDFNNRSLYSMIIYLNDCAEGGSTRMLVLEEGDSFATDSDGRFRGREENVVDSCPVEAGSVLLFYQNIVHEGEPVGAGCTKYIIRTDLMFKRDRPFCDSEKDRQAFRLMKSAEEIENSQKGPESAMQAAALFRKAFRMSPTLAQVYGS